MVLWPDEMIRAVTGADPKFPLEERRYLLQAVRYVRQVLAPGPPWDPDTLPKRGGAPGPVSSTLRERFDEITSGRAPDFQHWLTFVDEPRAGGG